MSWLIRKTSKKQQTKTFLPLPIVLLLVYVDYALIYFISNYDKQKFGLPMGNPHSSCLVYLFLESFESGLLQYVLPKNLYLRCIDDVLIIHPINIDVKKY